MCFKIDEASGRSDGVSRQVTTVPVNVIGGALVRFEIAIDTLSSNDGDEYGGSGTRESRSRGNSRIVLEAKPLGKPWRVLESYDSETYAISGASSADDETISEKNVNVNSLASFGRSSERVWVHRVQSRSTEERGVVGNQVSMETGER